MVTLPWVHVLHYDITSTMLRVDTDVFMKVDWYSINSVTTMVVTVRYPSPRDRIVPAGYMGGQERSTD